MTLYKNQKNSECKLLIKLIRTQIGSVLGHFCTKSSKHDFSQKACLSQFQAYMLP